MINNELLDEINVKVERAKAHLALLKQEIESFYDSKPFVILNEINKEDNSIVYFIDSFKLTPPKITAILGDAIHNLRSALDHLAYQLVWVGRNKEPSHHVYFPIADTKDKYINIRRKYLKGATVKAISIIDLIKPYESGEKLLWILHKFDNIDKHRALIVAHSALQNIDLGALTEKLAGDSLSGASMIPSIKLQFKAVDRLFPLRKGVVLFTDSSGGKVLDDFDSTLTFTLAFNEDGILKGMSVLEIIESMIKLVENIISKFEHQPS